MRLNPTSRALVFPPVGNYYRLLIHRVAQEDFDGLTSFSIGEGEQRRTVVCSRAELKKSGLGAAAEDRKPLPKKLRMSSPTATQSHPKPQRERKSNKRPDAQVYVPRALRQSQMPEVTLAKDASNRDSSTPGPPRESASPSGRKPSRGRGRARRSTQEYFTPRARKPGSGVESSKSARQGNVVNNSPQNMEDSPDECTVSNNLASGKASAVKDDHRVGKPAECLSKSLPCQQCKRSLKGGEGYIHTSCKEGASSMSPSGDGHHDNIQSPKIIPPVVSKNRIQQKHSLAEDSRAVTDQDTMDTGHHEQRFYSHSAFRKVSDDRYKLTEQLPSNPSDISTKSHTVLQGVDAPLTHNLNDIPAEDRVQTELDACNTVIHTNISEQFAGSIKDSLPADTNHGGDSVIISSDIESPLNGAVCIGPSQGDIPFLPDFIVGSHLLKSCADDTVGTTPNFFNNVTSVCSNDNQESLGSGSSLQCMDVNTNVGLKHSVPGNELKHENGMPDGVIHKDSTQGGDISLDDIVHRSVSGDGIVPIDGPGERNEDVVTESVSTVDSSASIRIDSSDEIETNLGSTPQSVEAVSSTGEVLSSVECDDSPPDFNCSGEILAPTATSQGNSSHQCKEATGTTEMDSGTEDNCHHGECVLANYQPENMHIATQRAGEVYAVHNNDGRRYSTEHTDRKDPLPVENFVLNENMSASRAENDDETEQVENIPANGGGCSVKGDVLEDNTHSREGSISAEHNFPADVKSENIDQCTEACDLDQPETIGLASGGCVPQMNKLDSSVENMVGLEGAPGTEMNSPGKNKGECGAGDGAVSTDDVDEDKEIDEDSWDALFDEEGEALDPSLMDELTAAVGKVSVKKAKHKYYNYTPKEPTLDAGEYGHLVEIYDFPTEFVTRDLLVAFKAFEDRGFDLKWVDDTHAIGIFSSKIAAETALGLKHPMMKVRPISEASKETKMKAKRCSEFVQPYKARPETNAAVARNLVAGALGMIKKVDRQKVREDRQKLREARDKKKETAKQKADIWDGSFGGKCAMDDY